MHQEYEHDIFICIKNSAIYRPWLETCFIPMFTNFILEDTIAFLGRAPKIFYYGKSLNAGDPWPDDLKSAIQRSRVALALCSPAYFYSHWCLTEFKSFHKRHELVGARVLIPIRIHDGDNFPGWATGAIQFTDFSRFVIDGDGFKLTSLYVEYQKELKDLSSLVAARLKSAPPFREWPIELEPASQAGPAIQQGRL
jgi:TIR domain